jgi:hypothetical protein
MYCARIEPAASTNFQPAQNEISTVEVIDYLPSKLSGRPGR